MCKKILRKNFSLYLSLFLGILILFFFIANILFPVSAIGTQEIDKDEQFNVPVSILEAERESSEENEKILTYLKTQNTKRNSFTEYPHDYAASYIDGDGELVIVLTEPSNTLEASLKEIAQNPDLKFEYADYSYEELTESITTISNALAQNLQNKKNKTSSENICDYIESAVLLDDKNIIEVSIKDLDDEKINTFKRTISSSPAIVFKEAVGENQDDAGAIPGGRINTISAGLSAAFRVKRYTDAGTEPGFLTCAHGPGNEIGWSIANAANTDTIGNVALRRIGGKYDISYVKLSSGATMGNTINGTYYTLVGDNDHIATPIVGKFIVLYGYKSGSSSGYIQSTNVVFTSEGISFSGMIGANYPRNSGDSGGVLCSDKNGYTFSAMGIHKGYQSGYSVFTSAKSAVNLWYLTRY